MRRLFACAVMVSCFASLTTAQAPATIPGARAATPARVIDYLITNAFRGISLSTSQRDSVGIIVVRNLAEQRAKLDFAAPDVFEKRDALLQKRNAEFRTLLTSEGDRAQFDKNLKTIPKP